MQDREQSGSRTRAGEIARGAFVAIFRGSSELVAIFALLIALVAIYFIYDRSLFSGASIVILSSQFFPLIVASMGQAVIMLTRGIDLSIGAVISLVMAVFAVLTESPLGVVGALLIALLTGIAAGAINGMLVSFAGLPPIIVTLAASFLWYGVTLVILPKPGGWVPPELVSAYNLGWNGIAVGVLALVVVLGVWKYIARTKIGLSIYAVGGNEQGAFASGIRVRLVKIFAYSLAGFFIALAGVALTIQTGTGDANMGTPYTLNSIAAAILGGVIFLGGVGYMRGVVMGAIVVALLPIIMQFFGVSPFYQLVVQGGVLIAAIATKYLIVQRKRVGK